MKARHLLYFDHNATTPVAPEALEAWTHAAQESWGNPSSIHQFGQRARHLLETSRQHVAKFLGCDAREIVFTSGGTESNNLAILGLPSQRHKVVTSTIEHPAVLGPCDASGMQVVRVGVDRRGVADLDELRNVVDEETAVVSIMHANNETGVVQPIEEIVNIAHEHGCFMHSDGVQAAGRIPVDVRALGVDLYSISAHKLYAPKGTGALYVKKGAPLRGIQFGGRHERGQRAGTENVAGAAALAGATDLFPDDHVRGLRDRFEAQILSELDDCEVNGAGAPRLPNTSNLMIRGVTGESVVIALDLQGISVSSGSACSSGSSEPSHVLLAMGLTREEAASSVRISFGRYNTEADVDRLTEALLNVVSRARRTRSLQHA